MIGVASGIDVTRGIVFVGGGIVLVCDELIGWFTIRGEGGVEDTFMGAGTEGAEWEIDKESDMRAWEVGESLAIKEIMSLTEGCAIVCAAVCADWPDRASEGLGIVVSTRFEELGTEREITGEGARGNGRSDSSGPKRIRSDVPRWCGCESNAVRLMLRAAIAAFKISIIVLLDFAVTK
jgi:hypothetical protein